MLDAGGRLTNIGSWYLGGGGSGVQPGAAGKLVVGCPVGLVGLVVAVVMVGLGGGI